MGHMLALFIQEPRRSRYTALGRGRGLDRTAHCRDAGRARPAEAAGKDGRCSRRPGAAAGRSELPRGRRDRQGEAATTEPRGGRAGSGGIPRVRRLSPARPVPAAPARIRSRRAPGPLSGPRGLRCARRNRSGRASRPSQFSLANFGCRQRSTRGQPRSAPPRRRALRASCAAPRTAPAPAPRVNKVAVGRVEEANCPGGAREAAARGCRRGDQRGWPRLRAGGGRALRVSCVHPPPAPRALSVPPWEQALPTQGGDRRSCPAAAGLLTRITQTHTHRPVRAPLAPALESVLVPAGCSDLKSKGKAQRLRRCSCRRWW